jgi:hypothetical protein
MGQVSLFGRVVDDEYKEGFVGSLEHKTLPDRVLKQATARDVFLWQAKNTVQPDWRRVAQEVGDCVSHGLELCCTMLLWMMAHKGEIEFEASVSSISLYGLLRVEVHGGRCPLGNEDGAAGSWGADAVKQFGVLLRKDYSQITGNPDHDLREYSGKKAKNWGYYGNGGQDDKDKLDEIAKLYPVQDVTQVRSPDEAAAAIDSGCPISIASMVGFEGDRDAEGIIRPRGQWPHQMMIGGVKYTPGGNRLFRIFNSWNGSVSGPDPGIDDPAISECSWWTTDDGVRRIFNENDSFAYSRLKWDQVKPYNFNTDLLV